MNFNINRDEVLGVILADIKDKDKLKKLTNLNEGSKWMLVINACVWAIVYFVNKALAAIYDAMFIDNADRYALVRHMKDVGLTVKGQEKATSYVRIGSSTLPASKRPIPQGAYVKTESGLAYELLEGGFIDATTPADTRGKYTIRLAVRAALPGSAYNVPVDAINTIETSMDGIDVVYNPEAISSGRDVEDTEDMRARTKAAKKSPGRGTMTWFKTETEKFAGVKQALVVPRYNGRGTVGIIVIGSGVVEDTLLTSINNYFAQDELDPAGAYYVSAFRPQYFIQDYTIKVWYDPAKGVPPDTELNNAMSDYYATLAPGQKQVLTVIQTHLLWLGLKDVQILSPADNVIVPSTHLSALGTITWQKEEWVG